MHARQHSSKIWDTFHGYAADTEFALRPPNDDPPTATERHNYISFTFEGVPYWWLNDLNHVGRKLESSSNA